MEQFLPEVITHGCIPFPLYALCGDAFSLTRAPRATIPTRTNEQRSSCKTRPRLEPARRDDDRGRLDDRLRNLHTSAESSRLVGSPGWLLAAWALAGVLTITGALCCAELAAMWPRAGGQYVFLREAYGPSIGFLFGWALFLVIQTGTIAAVAVAFANFTGVLTDSISADRFLISPLVS